MSEDTRYAQGTEPEVSPGPHLAKIVSYVDPDYMGRLQVQIMREVGNNPASSTELRYAYYSSPYFGYTNIDFNGKDPDDYDNTQKAFGMWGIPPTVGTFVIVVSIDGDPKKTYVIGCIQDEGVNFSVPGHAATSFVTEESKKTDKERVPVAEINKKARDVTGDTTMISKPASPLEEIFDNQGLLEDDIRGITTSSARREVPSSVFGISTPGPEDKKGKRSSQGKVESLALGTFVSRLPGSTFVMDDGDDKFIRMTNASEGPPEYEAVEQLSKGQTPTGDVHIPHNELIRLRTRTGHQILLHNSEDLIYIGNARGTAWIELSSDGKIDIFAEDSISVHTKQDLNFFADRDINIEAGRNLNIKVAQEMHTQTGADQIIIIDGNQKVHVKQKVDVTYDTEFLHHVQGDVNINFDSNYIHTVGGNLDISVGGDSKISSGGGMSMNSGGDNNLTAGGSTNLKSGGQHIETASAIHMNGPGAAEAEAASTASQAELPLPLKTHSVPDQEGSELVQTIMRRLPIHEPWPHHENLDPVQFKPDQLDRDIDGRYEENSDSILVTPEYFKKYTTITDTFAKIKGDDSQEAEE